MITSFDNFKNNVAQANWSIIDIYEWEETIPGYTSVKMNSNSLVTIFFNTKSPKITVRLRRALWWFIHENFFEWSWNDYLKEYKWDILNQFESTWTDLEKFLNDVKIYKISRTGAYIKNDSNLKVGNIKQLNIKLSDIDVDIRVSLTRDQLKGKFHCVPKNIILPGTAHPVNIYLLTAQRYYLAEDDSVLNSVDIDSLF